MAIIDSLILCQNIYRLGGVHYQPKELVELINAITGWDYTFKEVTTIGERINTLCRAFNVRDRVTRKDEYLSDKFKTPL